MLIKQDKITGDYNCVSSFLSGTATKMSSVTVTIAEKELETAPYFYAIVELIEFTATDEAETKYNCVSDVKNLSEQLKGKKYVFYNGKSYAFSDVIYKSNNVSYKERLLSYGFNEDKNKLTLVMSSLGYSEGEGGTSVAYPSFKYYIIPGQIVLDGTTKVSGDLHIGKSSGITNLVVDEGTLVVNSGSSTLTIENSNSTVNINGNDIVNIENASIINLDIDTTTIQPTSLSTSQYSSNGAFQIKIACELDIEKNYYLEETSSNSSLKAIIKYNDLATMLEKLTYTQSVQKTVPFVEDVYFNENNLILVLVGFNSKKMTYTFNLYEIPTINYNI